MGPIVRSASHSVMRDSSRLSRVCSRFASITQKAAVRLYQGACD